MKKTGLFSSARSGLAIVTLAMATAVPGVSSAIAADDSTTTVIAKPVRDWQEPPIQDMTGRDGHAVRKICSIESRFDNEVLMAIMRNKDAEYALRMFFPTMMFAPGVTYPIKLTAGGNTSSFDAVPVYPGTILVELGKDDALVQAFRDTGSLKIALSKSVFEFKSGDLENGMDLLSACADTLGASVNSAGVAGPLPTSSGTQTSPGMAMPPSVASIDAPSKVEVADLGQTEPTTATGQGHVQEQMVQKPLKAEAEADVTANSTTTAQAAEQPKGEPEKSGFTMFSIFGDVDEDEMDGEGAITAEKHYTPEEDRPVMASAKPMQAVDDAEESAVEGEMSMGTAQVATAEKTPEATTAEASMGTAVKSKSEHVEPASTAEETTVATKVEQSAPQPQAQPQPKPKPQSKPDADDDRMIVFADEEPVLDPIPQPQGKPEPASMEKVLENAQKADAVAAAQSGTSAVPSSSGSDVETRLAELEKRLSAEVDRNRQLEMQLRDMTAKPVSGTASIDLNNPDKPADVPEAAETSTQDRVAAAREERERIKSETLNTRMETLINLLEQAGVAPVASPAPVGSLAADNNSFSWHTGKFYGGAEFGTKPRDVGFSTLVSAYLDATGQRCEGDFASHLDRMEMRSHGSIATAELVCVDSKANTAAAVVFYEDSQTFGVITHEGTSDELSSAIEIRDSIASAIEKKL